MASEELLSRDRVIQLTVSALRARMRGTPWRVHARQSTQPEALTNLDERPDIWLTVARWSASQIEPVFSEIAAINVVSFDSADADWGSRFAVLRRRGAARDYAIVDPLMRRSDSFHRNEQGEWIVVESEGDPAFLLKSIGCTVPLAEVFDGVDPPA